VGSREATTQQIRHSRPSVKVEHEVWDKMAELKKNFPPGLDYINIYDPTTFVRGSPNPAGRRSRWRTNRELNRAIRELSALIRSGLAAISVV
jgi:hypothetical protein